MIEKYDIRVAQLRVEFGGEDYYDNLVSMEELTGYYDRTGNVPTTSGVAPGQYVEIFESLINEDPDTIILHICTSAQLTNGYQSSIIADNATTPVYRIDTKNVSIRLAFIVLKTIELIEAQPEIEPEVLVARIEEIAAKTRFAFIPGNIDYLRAGGRISNAQFLSATLLKIKPLIEVIDGFLLSKKRYRGSMKLVVRRMLSEYFEKFNIDKDMVLLVYSCAIDERIKDEMEKQVELAGVKSITWLKTGGVITSHAGPGSLGIAGMEV